MALKLRVISNHYRQLGKLGTHVFNVSGGKIGRSSDNDWVLPDAERYLSSHHAQVKFKAGKWLLEDISTNGVFVNDSTTPLSQQGLHVLKDGDRIRMGDYDILVGIDEHSDFPFDSKRATPKPTSTPRRTAQPINDTEELDEALDIHELLGNTRVGDTKSGIFSMFADPASPPSSDTVRTTHNKRPAPAQPRPISPNDPHMQTVVQKKRTADWNVSTQPHSKQQTIAYLSPTPEPERRPAEASSQPGVDAFCRGAGLDLNALSIDSQVAFMTLAGQMLREATLGLMQLLKERPIIKQRNITQQVSTQQNTNNPLKLAKSADEALRKLFDSRNRHYASPVQAVRDAYTDIKTHETATAAAMRASIDELMRRFNPTELQELFNRSLKRTSLLNTSNKAKYWDLYTEFHQVLNQRDEHNLPAAFAEDFSRLYSEQVQALNAPKKKNT